MVTQSGGGGVKLGRGKNGRKASWEGPPSGDRISGGFKRFESVFRWILRECDASKGAVG